MDLGKPFAYGRTAEIYTWEEGQVLKLFYNWFELKSIEYEARISRAVQASDLPVPAVGDILRVNDRNGLVYQRVTGISMLKVLAHQPWKLFSFTRKTAELHSLIHTRVLKSGLPNLHKKLMDRIDHLDALSSDSKKAILHSLQTLPDGDRLCHGDFHPDNILMTSQGEVIIDWIDASYGNPLADVARTSIILLGAADCQVNNLLEKVIVRIFHSAYLRQYFKLNPGGQAEYRRWLPILAAARLWENIPELEKWLVARATVDF